jgi:tetratricopeptide (TPR) repeat protein
LDVEFCKDSISHHATRRKSRRKRLTFAFEQKQYEKKEFKKAIKTADAILKKYPNHGGALFIPDRVENFLFSCPHPTRCGTCFFPTWYFSQPDCTPISNMYILHLFYESYIESKAIFVSFAETLAMKALVVNSIDKRKQEAYELARRGCRHDVTSAMTWHVLAILYRSDQCYAEAMRCMNQALWLKPGDRQILRELSGIQVQARDYAGLYQTRKLILTTEPKLETNWLSFAVAAHLRGDYNGCLSTIDNFEEMREKQRVEDRERRAAAAQSTGKNPDPVDADKPDPFEQSEILMYKNMVIQEKGDLKGALENLETIKANVVDNLAWKEAKGS